MPFYDATDRTMRGGRYRPPPDMSTDELLESMRFDQPGPTGWAGLIGRIFQSGVSGEFLDPTGELARAVPDYLRMMGRNAARDVLDTIEHPENLIGPGRLGMARVPRINTRQWLDAVPGETVSAAAIRFEGQIFRGRTHYNAAQEAGRALGRDPTDVLLNVAPEHSGFLTSAGRFVSRDEAAHIATRRGQFYTEQRREGFVGSEELDLPRGRPPNDTKGPSADITRPPDPERVAVPSQASVVRRLERLGMRITEVRRDPGGSTYIRFEDPAQPFLPFVSQPYVRIAPRDNPHAGRAGFTGEAGVYFEIGVPDESVNSTFARGRGGRYQEASVPPMRARSVDELEVQIAERFRVPLVTTQARALVAGPRPPRPQPDPAQPRFLSVLPLMAGGNDRDDPVRGYLSGGEMPSAGALERYLNSLGVPGAAQ